MATDETRAHDEAIAEPLPGDHPEVARGADVQTTVDAQGGERSAEIYVLRQAGPTATPANVIPIRPGALDALSTRDSPPGASGESVELSKKERDAFREIARALVGRPHASGEDRVGEREQVNPVAQARDMLDLAFCGAVGFGRGAGRPAAPAR